jgi:sirohydrochlorin cobaltochelatase
MFQYISPRRSAHEEGRGPTAAARGQTPGLLIVGHGTCDAHGQRDFWTTVRQVAQQLPATTVAGCFLERTAPDLASALAGLARSGVRTVVLAPLLLFAAGHARRDIPAIAGDAGARLGLQLLHADVLGCHHLLIQLSATRFRAALGPESDPQDVLLLMVGRGSQDADATAAMHRFVDQRLALTPVGRAAIAFLAMAHPRVVHVLPDIVASSFDRVVVQPHLLYRGALWSRLERMVQEQDSAVGRQRWTLADCLGCDWAVAQVVVERFRHAVLPG